MTYGNSSGNFWSPALYGGAELDGPAAKLRRLDAWHWRVMLSTPFILLLTWCRLQTGGYRKTLAAAQPSGPALAATGERLQRARETSYAVAVAVKYGPWRPRCLLRSLALGWFLGRRGIPFDLRIGVPARGRGTPATVSPDFSAHAWVEVEGVVVNDRDDVGDRHVPFAGG